MLIKAETSNFEIYYETCNAVLSDTTSLNPNISFEDMEISPYAKIDISTSGKEFINKLLTSDSLILDGTVTVNNKKIDINEYYDFDSAYKLDIVDWAKEIGLITEAEKIETYCDIII